MRFQPRLYNRLPKVAIKLEHVAVHLNPGWLEHLFALGLTVLPFVRGLVGGHISWVLRSWFLELLLLGLGLPWELVLLIWVAFLEGR